MKNFCALSFCLIVFQNSSFAADACSVEKLQIQFLKAFVKNNLPAEYADVENTLKEIDGIVSKMSDVGATYKEYSALSMDERQTHFLDFSKKYLQLVKAANEGVPIPKYSKETSNGESVRMLTNEEKRLHGIKDPTPQDLADDREARKRTHTMDMAEYEAALKAVKEERIARERKNNPK
jgi:hypothetical protein